MRGNLRFVEDLEVESREPGMPARTKSHRVRMSIMSREVMLLIVCSLGIGGLLVVNHDTDAEIQPKSASIRGHEVLLESVIFEPRGGVLISCGWDKMVRFWDVDSDGLHWGREIDALASDSHLFSVAVTSDGRFLAAGGIKGLTLWTRDGDRWKSDTHIEGGSYRAVAFSPDNRTLAFGTADGSIRLWDLEGRREMRVIRGFTDELRRIDFTRDGATLAGISFRGELGVWDFRSGQQISEPLGDVQGVQAFAFTPDSKSIALAEWSASAKSLTLRDLRTGHVRQRLSGNVDGVNALQMSPDGRLLVSADMDRSIRIWDLESGSLKEKEERGVGWVKTIAIDPSGRRVAFGGQNGTVQCRELKL